MYQTLQLGRVLFVYWSTDTVTHEDALSIPRLVSDARQGSPQPLIYVAVASESVPPPSDDVRKLMADHMESMLQKCDSMHLVFLGTGFRHAVQRMAMVSIMLISGKRKRIFIEATLDSAMLNAPDSARSELKNAIGQARSRGFFTTKLGTGTSL